MWFDAVFYTLQSEYYQNLLNKKERKENPDLVEKETQLTSLSLMEYFLPPDSPNEFDFDFEIPDSDSGEKKLEEEEIFLDPNTLPTDSTKIPADSLLADTVKIDWRTQDSTARLEQFRFQREDKPYVDAGEKKQSKFFAQPTASYKQRTVKIDSTGQFVEVREKVAGHEPKLLLRMTIDDYVQLKLALKEREDWEKLAYAYDLKSGTVGLSELITSFTDFEIPLPSVGVLSIFGEPKISLKIGGSVQIHGAWRSETTEGVTANRLGNTRNEPDFKQQVQINVSGTIGDKLNINADWNTERTFEYENQLKIKYTGYEDEIIQNIEAGNVSMQTPSLIGGAEALFGVKALFQMGPFKLTALASQKKGETKEVSVSGGSTSQDYSIRAYDYSESHYFVDKIYSDRNLKIFENFYSNIPSQYDPQYNINEIEVWKSVNQIIADQSKIRFANCFINLPPIQDVGGAYADSFKTPIENPKAGKEETGKFLKLEEGVDYVLHAETGYLSFKTSLNEQDVIGVAFKQGPNSVRTYGQFLNNVSQNDTLNRMVLKLIKPRNLQPTYTEAWSLRLKNIYPTGARNVKPEGFEFKIKYEVVGQEPTEEVTTANGNVRLIQAFGFDQQGSGGSPNPDNIFDWRVGLTIFPETGEVIFPTLEPFGQDIPQGLEQFAYQSIYDTTKTYARQDKAPDKWVFSGKNTGTSSATYQLGFNIVENSVKVRLSGRELREGTDYIVDYNIGQLTIRNEAALVPGADLKISYEQNDLFQLASKTLLGARGIYDFSDKTSLGFTVMNLNQETLSDKVRIGEEPLSNTIYGVDFKTSADLPVITNALDLLISTKEMSTFNFNGEYAYMSPDPNTKKSTIPDDAGESIAYIDDFEGAKRIIPIGVNYTGWKDLSVPEGLNIIGGLPRDQRMDYKAKSIWFTVTPSDVVVDSIYGGRKQVARSDQQITVLDYVFLPDTPGTYNWEPDLAQKENNWGGMQRLLSSTANNLVEQNIEFVEFWMQIKNAPLGATINLDLGVISEDVIPNNQLNTEDQNLNDAIDEGEDTGLDQEFNAQERITHTSSKFDPSGDDFTFSGEILSVFDYFNINGTEGNAVLTDVGLLPDTEDLNRNGSVDLANNYYRYTIPLTTDTASNPFIAGGGFTSSNWFLYRIPLKDTSAIIGNPSFANVETIRLYVQGVDSLVWVRLTEFNLVGNQWQKLLVEDSVMAVSTVSYEENQRYTSPPGVFRERDRTRPDEEIYNNEQALSLIYTELPEGESREAVKYLFRPLDVFSYSQMKLYIHGDLDKEIGGLSYNNPLTGQYSSEAFFRFGTDTANYYEYRQPVDSSWTSISINFSELTAIKLAAAAADTTGRIKIAVPGKPGHFYIVKGSPTLTSVKYLSVGVFNIDDDFNPGPLSGEVWINEIRVVGADDTPGQAFTFNTSLKLADLMTVNFNMSQTDPYFHRLPEKFGSRVENQNWAVSTDLDVLKLIPFSMRESNLKVSYSHTESLGKPLYIPGTDVKVDEAATQLQNAVPDSSEYIKTPEQLYLETQTLSVTNSISSSNIKLKLPTDVWFVRDTWNSLSFGFNYNNRFNRSPTVLESTSWLWNASTNYAFNFSPDLYIKLSDLPIVGIFFGIFKDYKDLKIYFTPQNFSANVTANRNRNSNQTRPKPGIPTEPIVSQDFTTGRGFNFNWKLTEGGLINFSVNYNVNMNSSLAGLLLDSTGSERPESDIWNDIVGGVGFGQDYRYQQSFDIRTAPKLPSLWDINRYFTLTAGYSVGYRWDYDLRQEQIGRSAGNNQKFTTGLVLRWKSLTEPLFGSEETKGGTNKKTETEKGEVSDSSGVVVSDKPSSIGRAFQFLVSTIQYIFFDWDNFTTNYSHDYSVSKSGIKGTGTGFYNFWGITQDDANGPSRAFQLGLSSDVGPRAFAPNSNTNLSDLYSEKNNIDFKTARPLWEGAKIDINWNVNWSENKNVTLNADGFGNITITNTTATGSLTRSFLSLPPSLPLVESGIQKVFALYNPNATDPRKSLSDAFVEGFETFPILSSVPMFSEVTDYIPRANWRITWDGLEKILFFKSLAQRISLDHAYSSTYTQGWKLTAEGNEEIQTQRIEYGFTPFAGLNITFGQVWGGNLNGSIKFSSRTTYDLSASTTNINETLSRDIGLTASFSKAGFDVPLFGVSLKNDVEFLISYTSTKNSVVRYEMNNFTEDGIPQDGTTRTTIEPRIKYTISSKVSLSIYYKRSSVEPEGAARIPPTTTNEAGLDVNIVIQ